MRIFLFGNNSALIIQHLMRLFRGAAIRSASLVLRKRTQTTSTANNPLPEGFTFWSRFFDDYEQRLLLTTALSQLDATENIRTRRLQRNCRAKNPVSDNAPIKDTFLPDDYYTFHDVSHSSNPFVCASSLVHLPRATTTMLFGIIARCASLPGRSLKFAA